MSNNIDPVTGIDLGGRPVKKFDKKTFENLCKIHCTKEEVCAVLDCHQQTLSRWCHREYGESFQDVHSKLESNGKASLRRYQWKSAEKGDTSMQKWLGKQYLNQKDISVQEVRAEIRADVKAEVEAEVRQELDVYGQLASAQVNIDLKNISDADLEKLEEIMKRVGDVNDPTINAEHKEGTL